MFTHVGAGITGMYDITVISVIVACIVALVKEYGGIAFILSFIKKRINGERGGELGIAALALLVVHGDTANNTGDRRFMAWVLSQRRSAMTSA